MVSQGRNEPSLSSPARQLSCSKPPWLPSILTSPGFSSGAAAPRSQQHLASRRRCGAAMESVGEMLLPAPQPGPARLPNDNKPICANCVHQLQARQLCSGERRSPAHLLGRDLCRVSLQEGLDPAGNEGDSPIRGEIRGWVGKGCSEGDEGRRGGEQRFLSAHPRHSWWRGQCVTLVWLRAPWGWPQAPFIRAGAAVPVLLPCLSLLAPAVRGTRPQELQ